MTLEEWMKMVRHLKTVYTNDKFIPTKDIAEMWFEYLKDMDFVYIKKAVKNWVEISEYYPTIADIRTKALEYKSADLAKLQELKNIFQACHSWYPVNLTEVDDWQFFKKAITSERFEEAKTKALKIKSEIMRADKLTKTFKEYVNEISRTKCD